jgi:uncharacterized membrane protein HdeD (DUF308 family)
MKEEPMSEQTLTGDIKRHSTWGIFNGVLTALVGVFLIAYPLFTATITSILLGWVLIFAAIAQFVFAFHSHSIGKFFLKVLSSVLYLVAGIGLTFFPISGVIALTAFLGTVLVVAAGIETTTAFQLRPIEGWGWFLFDAAATLLMGILILAGWPSSSVWAIGTLVGVSVLMNGISRIMIATKIRNTIAGVESPFRRAA